GAYTDAILDQAKISSFNTWPSFQPDGDVSGNQVLRVSPWQFSGSLNYRQQVMGDWEFYGRGDVIWRDSWYIGNDNQGVIPAHTYVNLRFGLESARYSVEVWADAALLADFRYNAFRAPTPGDEPPARAWTMLMLNSKPMPAARLRRLHAAAVVAESANLARFYSHEPPNVINPPALARRVAAEAQRVGLRCTIIDERRMAAMDMNALLAVGRGSAAPPRLIVLEHRGRGSKAAPVVLIGKAVTQDTGGYSIKAAEGIPDMKFDKCGGMAVLGAMIAAARLRLSTRVVGVIPAAENMIDARAYRPGDILTAMNGRTIEVISTDAEGRLLLADALTYAQRLFRPRLIIDLATLTGACVVALGHHAAGLFSNDDELASRLIAAGDAVGERLWRMPLWPAYRKQIEGTDADLKNSGGRAGGAVTAAMFLREFVGDGQPWAHLDIAGTAHLDKETPLIRRGATGFGVRLLLRLLRD
ncbi:MAG: hypothetical protein HUU22_11105, partial [Phycisphaerae bacterium]|nr:hypothetical protein [Phycisphaerae bacterium]